MTDRHREILERSSSVLLNDLDVNDVVPHLSAEGILTANDVATIHAAGQTTRRNKVTVLLDIIPRRGDDAYETFVKLLHKPLYTEVRAIEADCQSPVKKTTVPMTDHHREVLLRSTSILLNDMDIDNIVYSLLRDRILSSDDVAQINGTVLTTRKKKVAVFLDILPRRGDDAYSALLRLLKNEPGLKHLYTTMRATEKSV